ncbi:class II Aldolase and Adducin domain-containing protein [Diplocarpon rosae]|nr:class II Aldolase and Adducin domain-containing protein [Diplocarpon rosae]
MSEDKAPALISPQFYFIPYFISDASPVDNKNVLSISVVQSHSEAVLHHIMSGVSMRPNFHIAEFLGNHPEFLHTCLNLQLRSGQDTHVPTFDMTHLYIHGDQLDVLVNPQTFGSNLAMKISTKVAWNREHCVRTLLSGLGNYYHASRSPHPLHTHANGNVQTTALLIRHAAMKLDSSSPAAALEDVRDLRMSTRSQDSVPKIDLGCGGWKTSRYARLYSKSTSRDPVVDQRFSF